MKAIKRILKIGNWLYTHDYHAACIVSGVIIGAVSCGETAIGLILIPLIFVGFAVIRRLEQLKQREVK